jgi:hypothetical protein
MGMNNIISKVSGYLSDKPLSDPWVWPGIALLSIIQL